MNNRGSIDLSFNLSDKDIQDLEKLLGKSPEYLEMLFYNTLNNADNKNLFPHDAVTKSIQNHLLTIDKNKSILSVSDTLSLCGKKVADTNEILLHMALKGVRVICQDIIINASEDIDNEIIQKICWTKNMAGIPVFVNKIIVDNKKPCNELILHQNTIGIISESSTIPNIVNEGDLIYYVTLSNIFTDTFKPTAPNLKINEIPEETIVPLLNRILLEFIADIINSGILNYGEVATQSGIISALTNLFNSCNSGISLSFAKQDCTTEPKLTPKILLSAPFPGLLLVVTKSHQQRLETICSRHQLDVQNIGQITNNLTLNLNIKDTLETSIPACILNYNYFEVQEERSYNYTAKHEFDISLVSEPDDLSQIGKKMLDYAGISLKNEYSKLFDHHIGSRILNKTPFQVPTVIKTFGDKYAITTANEIILLNTSKSIENQILVGVSRAIGKTICCGAVPQQIHYTSNNNTILKKITTLTESIEHVYGIKTGYLGYQPVDLSEGCAIVTLSVSGLIDKKQHFCTIDFKQKGDMVYIMGNPLNDIASSRYLSYINSDIESPPPCFDLFFDSKLKKALQHVVQKGLVKSAHIIQEGGIFMTLIESSLINNLGFDITSPAEVRSDAFLFGESPLVSLVSVSQSKETAFIDMLISQGLPFYALGHVTREELRIDDSSLGFILDYKSKLGQAKP
ncbi:MAG: hypothetical protein JXB49_26330 [Bacteroidales bacterium]|nr:hypothetical protein [Bacteroidales bacterium]